jgi:hypothetical protein
MPRKLKETRSVASDDFNDELDLEASLDADDSCENTPPIDSKLIDLPLTGLSLLNVRILFRFGSRPNEARTLLIMSNYRVCASNTARSLKRIEQYCFQRSNAR